MKLFSFHLNIYFPCCSGPRVSLERGLLAVVETFLFLDFFFLAFYPLLFCILLVSPLSTSLWNTLSNCTAIVTSESPSGSVISIEITYLFVCMSAQFNNVETIQEVKSTSASYQLFEIIFKIYLENYVKFEKKKKIPWLCY